MVVLAGCGTAAPPGDSASAPPPPAAPVAPSATVTGTCVAGVVDQTDNEFYSMADIDEITPGPGTTTLPGYQVTLTNTGTATADITGFAVAFFTGGTGVTPQETGSDKETFTTDQYVTAGQSLTWTEQPWAATPDAPFAAGVMGAVDTTATCRLVQWFNGAGQ